MNRSFKILVNFCVVFMCSLPTMAHWEPITATPKVYKNDLFVTTHSVQDWLYSDLVASSALRNLVDHKQVIPSLVVGMESSNSYVFDSYCEIELNLQIEGFDASGASVLNKTFDYSDSVKIKYDPASGTTDFPSYILDLRENILKVECTILGIKYRTITGSILTTTTNVYD